MNENYANAAGIILISFIFILGYFCGILISR